MTKIEVPVRLDLDELAVAISIHQQDEDVLAFLADLDTGMASWDFTAKAADFFVRTMLTFDEEREEESSAKASLARVQEFLRQVRNTRAVDSGYPIAEVHTDPNSRMAPLNLSDLSRLIELATISLTKSS